MDYDNVKSVTIQESMDKYYNDIIDNLRLNLQVAENRIRRLQDSEFKLESEIEILKEEISELKKNN
jgi:chaperonin cofactor prefoldin